MRETLGQRNFALLWIAGLISLLGDRAIMIALPFYVYQQTGSTLATAGMFTAYYLPVVLLGSVAGVFVDRWDRKRIMIVTSLIQTGVMLLLLLVHSADTLWLVYLVTFIELAVAAFFGPAESALLPLLVSEDKLISANALNALNNNLARLIGPPVGGVLIALFGLGSVAAFDSASFLIAALLITLMRVPATARREPAVRPDVTLKSAWRSVWREWIEGLQVVRNSRMIAALFIIANVTSFGGTMFDPLIAPFVESILHGGADALAAFSTSGALGGLLGGLLLGHFGHGRRPAHIFAFGAIVAGAILLVMYNLTALPAVLTLSFIKSIPLVGCGAGLQTLLQTHVLDRYRGRIYGSLGTTNALLGLVSIWLAGVLAQIYGIVLMLSVAAIITIFAGILALLLLRNDTPEPVDIQETDQEEAVLF